MEEKEEEYEQLGLGCSSMGGKSLPRSLLESPVRCLHWSCSFKTGPAQTRGSCCFDCRNISFSSPWETQPCPPACSLPADGQAFHPDFICLAAWKAPIQLVHEMGCSSSISAPFLIHLITFDLDKIPLPPQEGQMTLCGSGCVPKDSIWLQAVPCTYPQCGRETGCPSGPCCSLWCGISIYLGPFEDQILA